MTLNELRTIIKEELEVDTTNLEGEVAKNCSLAQKYIDLLLREEKKLNVLQKSHNILMGERFVHYKTKFDYLASTQKELMIYINGDKDVAMSNHKVRNQEVIINFLAKTVDNFKSRGFALKSLVDLVKFLSGE